MIFTQSYKNLSYLQKKKRNFSSFIKEKQYLCTRITDLERRSNDGQATVKRQSKPTCSQRCSCVHSSVGSSCPYHLNVLPQNR